MLVPPPLPVLPTTLGTGGEGGLETVTVALPGTVPRSAAGIVTVILVGVTVVAGVGALAIGVNWNCVEPTVQFSVEKLFWAGSLVLTVLRKFVPVTVRAKSLPTVAQGETEVTVGT